MIARDKLPIIRQHRFTPIGWPIGIRTTGRAHAEQVANLNRNEGQISSE